MTYQMIKYDLSDLLTVFDTMLPATDEILKSYWLQSSRPDGITIQLIFNAYEQYAGIVVRCSESVVCSSVSLNECSQIRVLDIKKRQLEIIAKENQYTLVRCFLWLDGGDILSISYKDEIDMLGN